MRSFRRFVLVWLMLLAMPLQGMAAAGMLHCAGGLARTPQPVETAQHEVTLQVHDCGSMQVAGDALPASADHSCSACAACGIGAGLPVAVAAIPPALEPSSRPVAMHDAAPPSFIASGLERPPRSPSH